DEDDVEDFGGTTGLPAFLDGQYWRFAQHFLAEFNGVMYDASFVPDNKFPVPDFTPGRPWALPRRTEAHRYFLAAMTILVGDVPISGEIETVHVWHTDVDAQGETLWLRWTAK
ncbi:MAG TPA: hypothetical protein VHK90_01375, partial [Thermoanaerobaculia bacterium]|nr:hypothetical protein [Thermoanaerobaculia bacterium]